MDLVTGGTGFVGAHLVRALLADADPGDGPVVRCLVRPSSDRTSLAELARVEYVVGDLRDKSSLDQAVAGCKRVFHCAADYRLWTRDPNDLYQSNVAGTEAILEASRQAKVEQVVYTSSVGALGLDELGAPATEATPVTVNDMIGHYKRSKFLAERVAERFAQELPVVIVNPSTPVGEMDRKPTPTGQMVVDFLRRRTPAYVETGLNLVDVRDVARGHLLASARGRSGERYILGGDNMSLREIFELLADISGLSAPTVRLPHAIPYLAAAVSTGWAHLSQKPPRISLESVRMARKTMFFSSEKARLELGYQPGSVRAALTRAVDWFVQHGYTAPTRRAS